MVRGKTFCVKDFSTIFLRVVWISETSCKSLSINDLQAQGGGARKCLTVNDLQKVKQDITSSYSDFLFAISYSSIYFYWK